jgi:transcriptional regulator with XRE-family HTH domain
MNEKEFNEVVGNRIRLSRKRKGMTMKQLGKAVNLHESSISRYEKGNLDTLGIEKIKEFAKVLDVSPAYLLGWQEMPTLKEEMVNKWIDKVGELNFNEKELDELISYAQFIVSKRGDK